MTQHIDHFPATVVDRMAADQAARWFVTAAAAVGNGPTSAHDVHAALRQSLSHAEVVELIDAALPYLPYRPAAQRMPLATRHRVYQDWARAALGELPGGRDTVAAAQLARAAHDGIITLTTEQVVAAARAFTPLNSELITTNSMSIDPPVDSAQEQRTPLEHRRCLDDLAESYRKRFGYTCVVAAAGRHVIDVQREVRNRLGRTEEQEIATTRSEISAIVDDRLARALLERVRAS